MSEGRIKARLACRLRRTRLGREAMAVEADLSVLRRKPTPRVLFGLVLVALSYIIGWPAVVGLAALAYAWKEPWLVVIGGPLVYGLSHLVLIAGIWFAGGPYLKVCLYWLTRRLIEKLDAGGSRGIKGGVPWTTAHKTGLAAFLLAVILVPLGPLPAAIPLALFVLICLAAPFFPSWGFFLTVVSQGRHDRRSVVLTFDDGPDLAVTPRLLDLLACHQVPAIFFVVGKRVEAHSPLVKEILHRGHEVGNHSFNHDPLLMLRSRRRLATEIRRTQEALAPFGIRPCLFRPPVGITNPRLAGVLSDLGLTCATFCCRAGDFGNRRIKGLARKILAKVRPGAIILLHDVPPTSGSEEVWFSEVERLILGLRDAGYALVSFAELTGHQAMETLPPLNRFGS